MAVFEDKKTTNSALHNNVMTMVHSTRDARARLCLMDKRCTDQGNTGSMWKPPPTGWMKLNTDGAFTQASPGVASGGLLRDEHGKFRSAFMFKGGDGDCLTAELWGCLHGLKLAWDMGCKNIILEVDATDVVDLLQNPVSLTHEDRGLVIEIKQMIDKSWNVDVQLISRWSNLAADYLAKASLSGMPGVQVMMHTDVDLERIIAEDIM